MAKSKKSPRPKARLPRGFRDVTSEELRRTDEMIARIKSVYDLYGFEPLDTPAFEYTDALGKFLPDQDRPNAGVFSLQDEDDQWMSLRYDLTAPLARHVAENFQTLAKPLRRYAAGPVWRNEKPGPGRFRQFIQFDADTVGSDNIAADAEICMLAADVLEAVGVARGDYRIRVNNRMILDGILIAIGIDPTNPEAAEERLTVLRAMDKLDRLGLDGVRQLLGPGRKDDSGDFTKGANLGDDAIERVVAFLSAGEGDAGLDRLAELVSGVALGETGVAELRALSALTTGAGYDANRVVIDPSIVRGLDYYTGPVFEAELTFEIADDDGRPMRFGSVGGGGRYDDLVARFTGQTVPATGFSIGVSRLAAALEALRKQQTAASEASGPVVVLVMDRDHIVAHQQMATALRAAGIRAEMYVGTSNMRKQMQYADRRGAPCVVIQGESERAAGEIQIKDLIEGRRLSEEITSSEEWRAANPGQFSAPADELVAAVQSVLARYGLHGGDLGRDTGGDA
ncbi:MAG: histidine--tRNA ligase [Pseudomonadota bacterium]